MARSTKRTCWAPQGPVWPPQSPLAETGGLLTRRADRGLTRHRYSGRRAVRCEEAGGVLVFACQEGEQAHRSQRDMVTAPAASTSAGCRGRRQACWDPARPFHRWAGRTWGCGPQAGGWSVDADNHSTIVRSGRRGWRPGGTEQPRLAAGPAMDAPHPAVTLAGPGPALQSGSFLSLALTVPVPSSPRALPWALTHTPKPRPKRGVPAVVPACRTLTTDHGPSGHWGTA